MSLYRELLQAVNKLYCNILLVVLLGVIAIPPVFASDLAESQTTDTVVMISPDDFQYNSETATSNAFQHTSRFNEKTLSKLAMDEFKKAVSILRKNKIRVIVLSGRKGGSVKMPDAVFPNNWFSSHQFLLPQAIKDKTVLVIYPMLAKNRRIERQIDKLKIALHQSNIEILEIVDLTHFETQNIALEGTGSLVLDRRNHIAYTTLSSRTNERALKEFADKMNYSVVKFHSEDDNTKPIYHANVMMSVGSHFAVIAAQAINNKTERDQVLAKLQQTGKKIIEITPKQMNNMAGNILELRDSNGKAKIVMSQRAYHAFTKKQLTQLKNFGKLVPIDINIIETIGGGSVRCMLAEIFY